MSFQGFSTEKRLAPLPLEDSTVPGSLDKESFQPATHWDSVARSAVALLV